MGKGTTIYLVGNGSQNTAALLRAKNDSFSPEQKY